MELWVVKMKSKFKWGFPFHSWPVLLDLLRIKAWEEAETHIREALRYSLAPRMLTRLKLASYHSGHLLPRLWDQLSFYYGYLGHWVSSLYFAIRHVYLPPIFCLSHIFSLLLFNEHTHRSSIFCHTTSWFNNINFDNPSIVSDH